MTDNVKITLSGLWIALMLTYLLGDVLRIFSGDFKAGEIGGLQISQKIYLGMAILMVIPIFMVVLFPFIIWECLKRCCARSYLSRHCDRTACPGCA